MKKVIFILVLVLSQPAFAVEFKIHTNEGFVGFDVEEHWPVIAMQSKLPVAVAVFQIPNVADQGTQDSSNLSISLFDPKSERGRKAASEIGNAFSSSIPTTSEYKDWKLFTQNNNQGNTRYSIIDATKSVADVIIGVRVSWPHLPNNPDFYDNMMNVKFKTFLDSVNGYIGNHIPKKNEVIRRQIK